MKKTIQLIKNYILNLFKIIKEYFTLLLGMGLFVYELFNFGSDRYCDRTGGLIPTPPKLRDCYNSAVYYYYDHQTIILLVIGAILIAIGLLEIRKKVKNN